jgi:hypothetical protein
MMLLRRRKRGATGHAAFGAPERAVPAHACLVLSMRAAESGKPKDRAAATDQVVLVLLNRGLL